MTYPTILPRSARVLEEVSHERVSQDRQWGEQNHPNGTGSPSAKTEAHIARVECEIAAKKGRVTYRHVLAEEVAEAFAESDASRLRVELIQVAAVAVAWVEAIDRNARAVS